MAKIAISGTGRALRRHVIASLEKALAALGNEPLDLDDSEVQLLIEVGHGMDYNTMSAARHALDWARLHGHPYHLVMDPSVYDEAVSEYIERAMAEAAEQTRSTNISRLLEDGDILILGWEEDDHCLRALTAATKRGAMVYDQEFSELVLGDPDEDDDEDDYPEGPIEVWLSDSIQSEIREILAPLTDRIAELVERAVREAVETNTRVRNHQ